MSLYLNGDSDKWWYEFTIKGQRYRSSTRTADKSMAKLIEAEHYRSIAAGQGRVSETLKGIVEGEAKARSERIWEGHELPGDAVEPKRPLSKAAPNKPLDFAAMTIREAGELFMCVQRERRRAKTVESNVGALRRLVEFFGDIPLKEIHIGLVERYQSARKEKCGPSTVNHEISVLSRIMRRADLWDPIKKHYAPLKERAWKAPKIYTSDEQQKIFKTMKENPNLELAEIVFTITRNTTASGCELRGLRLRDIELEANPPRVHIPPDATKNSVRPRTIPLNEEAVKAFRRAIERASRLGSHYPEQYLFAYRVNRALYDPRRPASPSWLRKQSVKLRDITGIDHVKPHTFRHLAVTELLEKGAPEQTVIALAGWVSRRMVETYAHIRIEAKQNAVELLGASGGKQFDLAAPNAGDIDLTNPAVQAEIQRQAAILAQQQTNAQRMVHPMSGGRLITFPGAG